MKIEIDPAAMQEVIERTVMRSVEAGIGNWDVGNAIKQMATEAVASSGMEQQVLEQVQQCLRDSVPSLTATAARAVGPMLEAAMRETLTHSMVQLVCAARQSKYGHSEQQSIEAEVRNRMLGGRGPVGYEPGLRAKLSELSSRANSRLGPFKELPDNAAGTAIWHAIYALTEVAPEYVPVEDEEGLGQLLSQLNERRDGEAPADYISANGCEQIMDYARRMVLAERARGAQQAEELRQEIDAREDIAF